MKNMLIISFSIIKNILKEIRKKLILRKIDRIPYVACKLSMHCTYTGWYPSCLQTTWASFVSKLSSHTEPQLPSWNTSRRPSLSDIPSTSRTATETLQTC